MTNYTQFFMWLSLAFAAGLLTAAVIMTIIDILMPLGVRERDDN